MRTPKQTHGHTSQNPSEDLADRLLDRMGFRDALQACRENHWHGVLKLIQEKRCPSSFG